MNEDKLLRLLLTLGLSGNGTVPTVSALRRDFGMRLEVAEKWINAVKKLPFTCPYDDQRAAAASRRLRELCRELLELDEKATGDVRRNAQMQKSIYDEVDAKENRIINNATMSTMPEAPQADDYDYGIRLTTEDLKNFVPTDGLD